MKEHGDNGSTTTARGLPPTSHISSSDKLIRDQELQHLVTSSIPSPPYGGLSLINASAALVFGADPIYSTHLFASLAANNPNSRFQLPIPIPLALQPAPGSHPAHQSPLHHHHHHHQRNIFHHLPAAAVPAFAGLPGASLPNAAQLDILSSWVQEQASKSNDDRKITSTTHSTPNSTTTPNNNKKNGAGKNNNRKNNSQVNNKNNKNAGSGHPVIKLSKRSANGSANLSVAKANRKNKTGHHHLNHEGIVSSSENDMVIKKEEFEKDAEMPMSMSMTDAIIKPFIVEHMPVGRMSDVQKMEIEQSPPPSMKGGKGDNSSGSPSPNRIANNNNANPKNQGQISPGQNGSRDKVFTCPTCNRCFGYKHVLQNHERTHTGEKPFECTICMKKFTRDHHLKTHMRLHTGEKPYQCTHCDRQFVQVANLRRHLRVHTGERPYACELCSSRFSDSNQLKAHMLIHKGEKPYTCKDCGSNFRRRHHLAHHKCIGEETSVKGLFHHHPPSSSSPDTSPPQLLTPSSAAGSDRGDSSSLAGSVGKGSSGGGNSKRERKCRETRRIIRLDTLPVAATVAHHANPLTFLSGSVVPEQDHPEDLSMGGNTLSRSRSYSGSSSSVTGSSTPSPRSGLTHGTLLLRPYCNSHTSSSEETPDLFSDEDLRAADSSTNGKNESSSDDISFKSHHE